MEGVATTAYTGLKSYWRRKGYRRLSHPDTNNSNSSSSNRNDTNKRRRFRIPKPKLKLGRFRFRHGLASVRKFFLKIRDAYVNAMLGFASNGMIYGAGGMSSGFGGKGHVKEYDEKMLVEIYKRMILAKQQQQQQGILVAAGGCRRVASEVAPVSPLQ